MHCWIHYNLSYDTDQYSTESVFWLGMMYYANYDDFAFSNNYQPVTGYANWLDSKSASERQHCVTMVGADHYKWTDEDCGQQFSYICKGKFSEYQSYTHKSCYYVQGRHVIKNCILIS